MGTMTFQLPPGLPSAAAAELERCCLAGGPDNMPWPTESAAAADSLRLSTEVDESGYLVAPWSVEGAGVLMGTSATLMQRPAPYQLLIELARGKVNQVRNQAEEWHSGGLALPDELRRTIREATRSFGRAVCCGDGAEGNAQARQALQLGYRAADGLVAAYTAQVYSIRHAHQGPFDTALSCRLDPSVSAAEPGGWLRGAFNRASLPLSWHTVEGEETTYNWSQADRLLDWAEANELEVTAGPLIDFSSSQLPAWLWVWENDVHSIATFMRRFVEAAVRRYRARVRRWHLTAASNWANVLSLSEPERMALTLQLGDAARQVDPALELILGVTQPWGEYLATSEHQYSPFLFADHLIRSGLSPAGLDVEVVMGVHNRGSYCRDLLDLSRLLDLYALLGVPLQVTLGHPSSAQLDPEADPELSAGLGSWRGGATAEAQGEWARQYGALALCKPYVQAVQWAHFSDAQPHLFPNCGLVDRQGQAKPALAALRGLCEAHLR